MSQNLQFRDAFLFTIAIIDVMAVADYDNYSFAVSDNVQDL